MKNLKYLIFLLSLMITNLSCKKKADDLSQIKGVMQYNSAWKTNILNVCWENSVYNWLAQNPQYPNLLEELKRIATAEYHYYTNIRLIEWISCSDLQNQKKEKMVSISHVDGEALGSAIVGRFGAGKDNLHLNFSHFLTHQNVFRFANTLLHEIYHVLGGKHEHQRQDVKYDSNCKLSNITTSIDVKNRNINTIEENFANGNQSIIYIGKYDHTSISNYCRDYISGLSATDALSIGFLYGFPKSQQLANLMREKPLDQLLRTDLNTLPLPINPTSGLVPEWVDLVLWLQMWMSLDENFQYSGKEIYFSKNLSNALKNYQIKYNIEPASSTQLGMITLNTLRHFVALHEGTAIINTSPENTNTQLTEFDFDVISENGLQIFTFKNIPKDIAYIDIRVQNTSKAFTRMMVRNRSHIKGTVKWMLDTNNFDAILYDSKNQEFSKKSKTLNFDTHKLGSSQPTQNFTFTGVRSEDKQTYAIKFLNLPQETNQIEIYWFGGTALLKTLTVHSNQDFITNDRWGFGSNLNIKVVILDNNGNTITSLTKRLDE